MSRAGMLTQQIYFTGTSQRPALQFDPLGQEGVRIRQRRNRFDDLALRFLDEPASRPCRLRAVICLSVSSVPLW